MKLYTIKVYKYTPVLSRKEDLKPIKTLWKVLHLPIERVGNVSKMFKDVFNATIEM